MTEKLEIQPLKAGTGGEIDLPGSKSISNRALLFAAMATGKTTLTGLLRSEDTELMLDCLSQLGVGVDELGETTFEITGVGGQFPVKSAELYVGTAGTVARLLIGMLGVQSGGSYRIDGSEVMRKRPMKGLTDLLIQIGCEIEFEGVEGALPFTLKPRGFQNMELSVDASASSQVLSAALMAAPLAGGDVAIRLEKRGIRRPYVVMTARMMESFGISSISWNDAFTEFSVPESTGYTSPAGAYVIESDASAASYFLTLPLVTGGKMQISRFDAGGLQGDVAYAEVLKQLGAVITTAGEGIEIAFGKISNQARSFDFYPISDTFMTLAAVTPLFSKPIRITGIAHTRKQESDRVQAMVTELRKLGQEVEEGEDYLEITPNLVELTDLAREGVEIETYKDHRIAMSFGILGCADLLGNQTPWMTILDPRCCEKTFPGFFEALKRIANA